MMLPKVEVDKNSIGEEEEEDQKNLLKDIKTNSKTSSLEKENSSSGNSTPSKSKALKKEKKSIWNWKPLKALSLTRNKKFNCTFSLQVHLIEDLPLSFNDYSLCVHWKRRDEHLVTNPAKVIQGVVEFQDILSYTCSIVGSKSGPHNSAKYEAKHFLLYASVVGSPELDLGKHKVDITRLLPLALEDLEEEKSSGKWTTSFRLSGKAKGAVMNVSFGYVVVGDNTSGETFRDNLCTTPNVLSSTENCLSLRETDVNSCQSDRIRRTESLPSVFDNKYSTENVDEVKDLHEVFPSSKSSLSSPIVILYKKFCDEDTYSHLNNKPELDVLKENLNPIIMDGSCSPNTEGGNLEECNEGKTSSPVHDKSEYVVLPETLETVESDDYPLSSSVKENPHESEGNGFLVVDKGIEYSSNEHIKIEEPIVKSFVDEGHTFDNIHILDTTGTQVSFQDSVGQDFLDDLGDSSKESTVVSEFSNINDELCTKELLMLELESALHSISELETMALESPKDIEVKSEYMFRESHGLDDVTESVANEFLSMLGIDQSPIVLSSESEPESPRERLLRQFEMDVESEGFSLFDVDMGYDDKEEGFHDASYGSEQCMFSTCIEPPSSLHDLQGEHVTEFGDLRSKTKGHILEYMETEALMREWGLNEEAFQHSPPKGFAGFGSPIHQLTEEFPRLPPLAEGLGPFLQTKGGGFIRTMNPSLFSNAKSGGSLIMQVSNPVVVPAEMGSGIMEILQYSASIGIEKLSMDANKLMPLEDITGKSMQQISWEAIPDLDRHFHLQHDLATPEGSACVQRGLKGASAGIKSVKFSSTLVGSQRDSGLFSLEDLAPLAMDKIEALSIQGLKIQSELSEEDAPSNIIAQSFRDISCLQAQGTNIRGSCCLDGAAALQLLDTKDSTNEVDGIMGLSLTLDEWMKLDSGEIDDIDNIDEHTIKLLAAHHASSFDVLRGSPKGKKKQGKGYSRKCGLLGNNFTVAFMVQLHDHLRNYEPVGTPMLALIQVERIFVPPKQKIYRPVSEVGSSNEEDDESEIIAKVEMKDNKEEISNKEKGIAQFRITEVHVAGLKTETHRKKLWGTSSQQQSGSRWLIANGMGKNSKKPMIKSKVAPKFGAKVTTTKVQPGDTLWSISSRVYGTGEKWRELVALNPHIRNPNIIIPNETIRIS